MLNSVEFPSNLEIRGEEREEKEETVSPQTLEVVLLDLATSSKVCWLNPESKSLFSSSSFYEHHNL